MTTSVLSFKIASSGRDLHLTVTLGNVVIYTGYPEEEPTLVEYEFDDTQELEQVVCFELQGKLPAHTKINQAGEIVEDRCVMITDVAFDDIQLGHLFSEVTIYYHDTNGMTQPVTQSFYGIMGCNGRVEMRFTTPIYLWLLENM